MIFHDTEAHSMDIHWEWNLSDSQSYAQMLPGAMTLRDAKQVNAKSDSSESGGAPEQAQLLALESTHPWEKSLRQQRCEARGGVCDLVVESLSRIYKILGPIPSTVREKKANIPWSLWVFPWLRFQLEC